MQSKLSSPNRTSLTASVIARCVATAILLQIPGILSINAYHLLGNVKGARVVDLGCGSGSNSVHLALREATLAGLDISELLIRLARQRLEANGVSRSCRFIVGSAHDTPFEDDSIDVVLPSIDILH